MQLERDSKHVGRGMGKNSLGCDRSSDGAMTVA